MAILIAKNSNLSVSGGQELVFGRAGIWALPDLCRNACMKNLHSLPSPPPRISPKVRSAVDARVKQGASIAKAAEMAGMSKTGFAKALKRPAVQEHMRKVQETFVAEVEASRAAFKARAFEVALELMLNAKSETIRARMVEFLAGDGKAPQVSVHVDARQQGAGYEYVPPGSEVIEIAATKNCEAGEE